MNYEVKEFCILPKMTKFRSKNTRSKNISKFFIFLNYMFELQKTPVPFLTGSHFFPPPIINVAQL